MYACCMIVSIIGMISTILKRVSCVASVIMVVKTFASFNVFRVEDIFSPDYDALFDAGIRRLYIDFDGTLGRGSRVSSDVLTFLLSLQDRFTVVVLSNNRLFYRSRKQFFSSEGIAYSLGIKPFGRVDVHNSVIIGDKFLTDGLFAWWRDIPCFLVRKAAK